MTITLQDLQVLDEKNRNCSNIYEADATWAAFTEALMDYYRSGALQRLAELAEDGLQWRRIRELADDNQRIMVEMIEKHEAARAPSVKEESQSLNPKNEEEKEQALNERKDEE